MQHHQLKTTSTFFCSQQLRGRPGGLQFFSTAWPRFRQQLGFSSVCSESYQVKKFCQIISPLCWVIMIVVCTCLFIIVHQFLDCRITTYYNLGIIPMSARRITGVASACQMCPFLQTQIKGIHQSRHAQRIGGSHKCTAQHDQYWLFGTFWGPGSLLQ